MHAVTKPPEAERPDARSQRPVGIRDLTGTKIYARNVLVTDRDSKPPEAERPESRRQRPVRIRTHW